MYNRVVGLDLSAIEARWRDGQRREAVAELEALVADHPSDGPAWSLLGLYRLELGDTDGALHALDASLAIAPTYPAAYNAGNALLDRGELDRALQRYEQSIACFDRYPEAFVNRGIVLHRMRRTEEALASFERALAIDPDFVPGVRCKAIALEALGDKEGSEAQYARLVALCPGNVGVLSEYGRALSRLPPDNHMELEPGGRSWKALEVLNEVIAKAPDDLAAYEAKAEVLFRNLHANVAFRTFGAGGFEYVQGPLRTSSFAEDLAMHLRDAKARFPDAPAWAEYERDLKR